MAEDTKSGVHMTIEHFPSRLPPEMIMQKPEPDLVCLRVSFRRLEFVLISVSLDCF